MLLFIISLMNFQKKKKSTKDRSHMTDITQYPDTSDLEILL